MNEMFLYIQSISQKKIRTLKVMMVLFMIFESMWIFPLKYELSLYNAEMIFGFFMVGFILCAVTVRKPIIIFLSIILSSFIGLALRVWLEWGEVTITEGLTLNSVFLTYVPVIIIIYIGYIYTRHQMYDKQ